MNSKDNRGGRRPGAGRPKSEKSKRTVVFRLDESAYDTLTKYAKYTGKTRTEIVTECIRSLDVI